MWEPCPVVHQESLGEQLQILQGKVASLEDELQRVTKEERGENMGLIMDVNLGINGYLTTT